jgi:hypothetical protein
MIREQTVRARQKMIGKLPITGELLRGSLLERTVRHTKDCPKCARGEGHQVFVLTVTYPGQRTRQFSVRRERVAEVRCESAPKWDPAGFHQTTLILRGNSE